MARKEVKMAILDGVLTFAWIFCTSVLDIVVVLVRSSTKEVGRSPYWDLGILFVELALIIFVFNTVGEALGGASFNPTGNACLYVVGLPGDSLLSMALRFPTQAIGAVGGALAIKKVMPVEYNHILLGPSLKVDIHTGAIAEGVLTFIISLVVLIIILKVQGGALFKTWLISLATVTMVVVGSAYTGPSMNPANAFGWAYINDKHNTWEQFYVYWICPFVGAFLAAMVFRFVFPQPEKQNNKAKKEI